MFLNLEFRIKCKDEAWGHMEFISVGREGG